jgi:hypothetical protein
MAEALVRHEQLVAKHVHAHGGILIKSRGEGDATLSVFARATDAVTAACSLQDAFEVVWPGDLDLSTRIAIHTGEAELRSGDYYGGTINRAARIRGLATGGQILLSRATHDLVVDLLDERFELVEWGSHTLKGLQRAETVYLVLPSERATEPNQQTTDVVAIPLPHRVADAPASLVGRDDAMARLDRVLDHSGLSMVVIAGEPGIGKTALACAWAQAAHDQGAVVLFGACFEGAGIPYQPWVRVIEHLAHPSGAAPRAAARSTACHLRSRRGAPRAHASHRRSARSGGTLHAHRRHPR